MIHELYNQYCETLYKAKEKAKGNDIFSFHWMLEEFKKAYHKIIEHYISIYAYIYILSSNPPICANS